MWITDPRAQHNQASVTPGTLWAGRRENFPAGTGPDPGAGAKTVFRVSPEWGRGRSGWRS
jgi:hypothetical protein